MRECRLLYILLCVCVAFSCKRFEPVDVIESFGDDAKIMAVADFKSIAASFGKSKIQLNEITAIAKLRGVDKKRVGAVSYSPNLSALIFSIDNPRSLNLRDELVADSVSKVYRINDLTFFVADTAMVWLVDSYDGAQGALSKVSALREKAKNKVAYWKEEKLSDKKDICAIYRYDLGNQRHFVYSYATFEYSSLKINASCFDSEGSPLSWLPEGMWQGLPEDIGRIDPRNQISLAFGRINVKSMEQFLPDWILKSPLANIECIGPGNIAFNNIDDFRLNIILEDSVQGKDLALWMKEELKDIPGLKVLYDNSLLSVSSGKPSYMKGTSYKGSLMASVINIDVNSTNLIRRVPFEELMAIMILNKYDFSARIDLNGTKEPFISTLINLFSDNEPN